jgi:membrane protease YdiL (CAAX protease family)
MRTIFRSVIHSNAARLLLGLWFASAVYTAFSGDISWLLLVIAKTFFEFLLVFVTVRMTASKPAQKPSAPLKPARSWAQLGVVLVIIWITGFGAFGPPLSSRTPIWADMVDRLYTIGESILPAEIVGGPGNALANPVQYMAIPLLLLLLLGARLSELGLGRGYLAWRVSAVWSALPVTSWAILLVMGVIEPLFVARRVIGNALQNGFFEEFLFRGALQTRLGKLISTEWALIIQALVFGLWHLKANLSSSDGDFLQALAACIIVQTMSGVAYGIVFLRTRNLLAPSVAHIMMNGLGQTFG